MATMEPVVEMTRTRVRVMAMAKAITKANGENRDDGNRF